MCRGCWDFGRRGGAQVPPRLRLGGTARTALVPRQPPIPSVPPPGAAGVLGRRSRHLVAGRGGPRGRLVAGRCAGQFKAVNM